jgi:hypothetical protein
MAAIRGRLEVLKWLLQNGGNINDKVRESEKSKNEIEY